MIENVLFYIYSGAVLLFGVYTSAAFAGISFTKKNIINCLLVSAFSGILQMVFLFGFSEEAVWHNYPVITHLPLVLFFVLVYKKKVITSIVAVCTAYMCCQPSKWFGILVGYLVPTVSAGYIARITVIILVTLIMVKLNLYQTVAAIFNKDTRSVCVFGMTPVVYYIFDYVAVVYNDFFTADHKLAVEFLPFFFCIAFMIFCVLYYREYEQKSDAERKEQITNIIVKEREKELNAIKKNEHEIRIMRHDMRLLLNNISVCIENDDKETAQKIISTFTDSVDATYIKRYCGNTTINYIVSAFADKCSNNQIEFGCRIEVEDIDCDEIILSTIMSNALDNAINAQKQITEGKRKINLVMKRYNGKLLLSVKNTIAEIPVFADGVPVTKQKGHGYGTQSIIMLTARMGGNCQFTIEEDRFVFRVII